MEIVGFLTSDFCYSRSATTSPLCVLPTVLMTDCSAPIFCSTNPLTAAGNDHLADVAQFSMSIDTLDPVLHHEICGVDDLPTVLDALSGPASRPGWSFADPTATRDGETPSDLLVILGGYLAEDFREVLFGLPGWVAETVRPGL